MSRGECKAMIRREHPELSQTQSGRGTISARTRQIAAHEDNIDVSTLNGYILI